MPYSTVDDIKKLLPEELLVQLTDDEDTGAVNLARAEEAIAQADAEIDSYCGERLSVPLSPAPEMVRKLSVDIAIYNLYSRMVREMPEVRAERYRNAVRKLEGIARGIISLGIAESPASSSSARAETNRPEDGNVFSRDKLRGF